MLIILQRCVTVLFDITELKPFVNLHYYQVSN
jgi:hypothetical protein